MKRKIGVWLLVAAYAIFLFIAITSPFFVHSHQHVDAAMLAEYFSPWPAALTGSLGLIGIILALVPIRRGEHWAMFTSLATFVILFVTRMATDPRCLVVLDVHQHGRHASFVIPVILGEAGLILTSYS